MLRSARSSPSRSTSPMPIRNPGPARLASTFAFASALVCLPGPAPESRGAEAARPAEGTAKPAVTFNKDIAPLVFKNCTSCHRPGEVAPFPLLEYRDVVRKAELIRSVTAGRVMPPWKAEPGSGHFADERRLNDDEIALIDRWVEAGKPEGEPGDL